MPTEFWLERLKERKNLEDVSYRNRVRGCGLDLSGSGYRPVVSSLCSSDCLLLLGVN